MKVYIGIDIGGTKAHAGLITEKGNILRHKEVPSRVKESNEAARDAILELIAEMKGDTKIHGIGIGVAGRVDHVRNRIAEAGPNFLPRFEKINLVPHLTTAYEVPVIIENDAKVYALGEAVFGRGKGYRRVVTMTLGTGIGGGIIQDGHIIHGKNNLAGEVGQMFTRGSKKRWEQIAAGGAFNKHGDIQKGAVMIAEGLNNILNVVDPDVVVIGGGLSREKGLVGAVRKEVKQYLHYKPLRQTPIYKSTLVRNAPILGAMLAVHTGRV